MAVVYVALDQLLHRHVAVKVLRQQYVNDEEFIQRFRREAQSAASLSHPNVVSIYDVGQENDTHFIVMEYVEGTTLNEIIDQHAPLSLDKAIYYACEIAVALEHAHHNGIIHRDIKPHNILIGKNGNVKVTDFGIARAITASRITQTGSVLGSVHYLSPEHARGNTISEKSDIYSLGIVMYEMLTSKLPFTGDNPITIAVKHVQDHFEEPSAINPGIPQSLENIILKALRKKPEERYLTAKSMLEDLKTCLHVNRSQEMKTSYWEDEDLHNTKTLVMPSIQGYVNNEVNREVSLQEDMKTKKDPAKTKSIWIKPIIWIIILSFLAGLIWNAVQSVRDKLEIKEVTVPVVINLPLVEAEEILQQAKLESLIIYEESSVDKDIVIRQNPMKMNVLEGTKITLYVSTSKSISLMDNYINTILKDTMLELEELGVSKNQITVNLLFTDDPPDTILQQSPSPNEPYDPTTVEVKLSVSKGRETFKMPDLIGLTEAEAKAKIEILEMIIAEDGITREKSYKQPRGRVISQLPYLYNDDVSSNATIQLVISDGLPDEAGQLMISIPIKPSNSSVSSEFKIIVTDAQYDEFVYRSETITAQKTVEVRITVSPDARAVIQVKENDSLVNTITKSYQDYLDSKGIKPIEIESTNEDNTTDVGINVNEGTNTGG